MDLFLMFVSLLLYSLATLYYYHTIYTVSLSNQRIFKQKFRDK